MTHATYRSARTGRPVIAPASPAGHRLPARLRHRRMLLLPPSPAPSSGAATMRIHRLEG